MGRVVWIVWNRTLMKRYRWLMSCHTLNRCSGPWKKMWDLDREPDEPWFQWIITTQAPLLTDRIHTSIRRHVDNDSYDPSTTVDYMILRERQGRQSTVLSWMTGRIERSIRRIQTPNKSNHIWCIIQGSNEWCWKWGSWPLENPCATSKQGETW